MSTFRSRPDRPAPPGFKWIYSAYFTHWKTKKRIFAKDHGLTAFCFLVPIKD